MALTLTQPAGKSEEPTTLKYFGPAPVSKGPSLTMGSGKSAVMAQPLREMVATPTGVPPAMIMVPLLKVPSMAAVPVAVLPFSAKLPGQAATVVGIASSVTRSQESSTCTTLRPALCRRLDAMPAR